jgi:hypothetical protein
VVCSWGEERFDGADFIGAKFEAIAAGYGQSLALKSDGSIVGWGDDEYGQGSPPEGNDYVAVAAGDRHSLALKSDGSIVGWGYNAYGQASPPDGNDYVAIAAGAYHSLALKILPLEVELKITPRVVNAVSKGKWVKAHFVLPEEFGVEDVDVNRAAVIKPGGIESEYMNVFINDDGLVEVEAAFERGKLCGCGEPGGAEMAIEVSGRLKSGQGFFGRDRIRIVNNAFRFLAGAASHWLENGCDEAEWCGGLDVNRDGQVDFVDYALSGG